MTKLIARFQNKLLGEFPLHPGINTVGRLPSNDVCIENMGISRNHAFILGDLQNEIFVLEDLKSLNGTYVNKKRVQKHMLRHTDVITIGQHSLEYSSEEVKVESTPKVMDSTPRLIELSKNRVYPITKDVIYFGNSSQDDVHIPDLMVGKQFASLTRKGNAWILSLLVQRFSNLKLNGEEIRSAKIQTGDEIEVGGLTFKFLIPE